MQSALDSGNNEENQVKAQTIVVEMLLKELDEVISRVSENSKAQIEKMNSVAEKVETMRNDAKAAVKGSFANMGGREGASCFTGTL